MRFLSYAGDYYYSTVISPSELVVVPTIVNLECYRNGIYGRSRSHFALSACLLVHRVQREEEEKNDQLCVYCAHMHGFGL